MGEAGVDVLLAVRRPRPALPDRLRGHAAGAAHHAGPAPRGRRHAGRARAWRRPGSTERPEVFGLRPWGETEDPVAIVAGLVGAAGRVAVGDRTWARFVLDLQAALPGAAFSRAAAVIGPLRAVKDAAEIDGAAGGGRGGRPRRRRPPGGRRPAGGADRGRGVRRPRPPDRGRGPPARQLRHRRPRAPTPPAPTTRPGPGSSPPATWCCATSAAPCSTPRAWATAATSPAASTWGRRRPRWPRRTRCSTRPSGRRWPPRSSARRARRSTPWPAASSPGPATATGSSTAPATASASRSTRTPTSCPATPPRWPPGHAFSVEPGIYVPGRFGLRLEDIVVAADAGPDELNKADHGLAVVDR